MQRGHANCGAGHNNGLQHSKRRGSASAANGNLNVVENGVALFWRKLEGNGPAWRTRCETKFLALAQVVQFYYCPIYFVVQVVPVGFGARTKCLGLLQRVHQLVLGVYGEPKLF